MNSRMLPNTYTMPGCESWGEQFAYITILTQQMFRMFCKPQGATELDETLTITP